MRQIINGQKLRLGTCYYPEHWDKSLWKEDLERMLEAGIGVIRIAEFAWSKVEPSEGEYTYEFFDSFLDVAEEVGMQVIFCTPSATPPAWVTQTYPETLNCRRDGVKYQHDCRRHYNYNSPIYQKLVKNITEKFASHYASRPCIIGWQIDNELNCETAEFYSEADEIAFRDFLKAKYGSIAALNDAWGAVFWNQTYNSFTQVKLPQITVPGAVNPHKMLDYYRFVSDSCCRFAKMQSDIIAKYIKPDDFITTNGIFGNVDNHRMTEESLDFMTYDSYPNFSYMMSSYDEKDDMKDRKWSRNLAEVRSHSPQFGIMEQQSGANGWNTGMAAPTPRPGQMKLWSMQSVAHGADYVSYFRWRTCTFGTEIYWHGLLDYSGRENRRMKELREMRDLFARCDDLAGAQYQAEVGILKDYDNEWDAQLDVWHASVDNVSRKNLFAEMQNSHTPFDFVYMRENTTAAALKKYKVLFYPHATILTEKVMEVLKAYVADGGRLVMGCRTGYKQENGKCVMDYLPGLAAELCGTDIPEYTYVAPDEGKVCMNWDGEEIETAVFNDQLAPIGDGEVLACYTGSYYAGAPALIRNRYGKGEAYYFGGAFSREAVRAFLTKLEVIEPYADVIEAPACCELAVRGGEKGDFLFVLNYAKEPVQINLKKGMVNVETGAVEEGTITMDKYGFRLYRM